MNFTIGIIELVTFAIVLIGAFWSLLKMTMVQFEHRLSERFKTLDTAVTDVKRLELELLRNDARNAQLYVTKADHDKILERIFVVLERMDKKLDGKANTSECDGKHLRTLGRTQ